MAEAVAAGHRTITIDLKAVTFFDAASVAALVSCRDLTTAAGGRVRVENAGGTVAYVLKVLDVDSLLTVSTPAAGRKVSSTVDRGPAAIRPQRRNDLAAVSAELVATSRSLSERARGLAAQSRDHRSPS
ncbi:STAS domain-containing protein [Actinoplanes sp. TFC3]|uniref:STAS domain-containing protein n=1 Tax=Actinoplanes sp. TFC3 TaxID=1710355 RepID=UPI001F34A87C|nr:STAS domain-containing protein [Actinoplanes sp. TFC3]